MRRFWIGVLLIVFLSPAAQAAGVYKWVDEQGKVHYGDRPGGNNASKIVVPSSPPPSDKSLSERNAKRDKLLQTMEEERTLKEEDSRKAKQKSEERRQRCIEAQDKLKLYERARYIYKPAEGGQEIIFSEEEREKVTVEAKKAVEEWCN
jgi:hypothetical protein